MIWGRHASVGERILVDFIFTVGPYVNAAFFEIRVLEDIRVL